jgi:signal transduction histidine kinase
VIRQVADLLGPTAPAGLEIRIHAEGPIPVIADGEQVFRILFNLVHNAVAVARRDASLKAIDISAVRSAGSVAVRIADDGPGLPAAVRRNLFRPGVASSGGSGVGLSIARELAERNGATLKLADSTKGAAFLLELPAAPTLAAVKEGPVTRSLGRRAA